MKLFDLRNTNIEILEDYKCLPNDKRNIQSDDEL